jgi:hypothetical protein
MRSVSTERCVNVLDSRERIVHQHDVAVEVVSSCEVHALLLTWEREQTTQAHQRVLVAKSTNEAVSWRALTTRQIDTDRRNSTDTNEQKMT